MDKRIKNLARYVYLAQNSSDEGKEIHELKPLVASFDLPTRGYHTKDEYIIRAIRECIKLHDPNFAFGFGYNKGCYGMRVVYFSYRFKGDRHQYQVSFHSYNDFSQYDGQRTRYVKWDRESSRYAAVHMAEFCRILPDSPIRT